MTTPQRERSGSAVDCWVAVDPGARWNGMVARIGQKPVTWRLIDLKEHEPVHLNTLQVERTIRRHITSLLDSISELAGSDVNLLWAIEGVKPPNWYHRGEARPVSPAPILELGVVFGLWQGVTPGASPTIVHPGGHGSQPAGLYPAFDGRKYAHWGKGPRTHLRSAWDVSWAAPTVRTMNRSTP